jgi:hypothetical protein
MTHPSRLSLVFLGLSLVPALGCGLVQVNGKPLGGGWSSAGQSDGSSNAHEEGGPLAGAAAVAPSRGGKTLADIARPDPKLPVTSWTPVQQYLRNATRGMASERYRDALGFADGFGSVVLADELGSSLGHLGRIALIEACFAGAKPDASSALRWAVCGDDVHAVDLTKAASELRAEGLANDTRKHILETSKQAVEAAKRIGQAVEVAAEHDTGVQAVLAAGKAAHLEWKAFANASRDLVDTVRALQGAARGGHAKGFAGCAEKTRPAFEKLVRARTFADDGGDREPLVFYIKQLRGDLASHMVTLAYAACAAGMDRSGEAIYTAIGNGEAGQVLRGARTLAIAKLYAPSFKPKFADRALSLADMQSVFRRQLVQVPGNDIAAIMTPRGGKIATITRDGEVTRLRFAADKVERCLEWRATEKIVSVGANGEVQYEKRCARRGLVQNQEDEIEIATRFAAGLKAGMSVTIVNNFAVVAWSGATWHALLGVALQ